MHSQAGGDQINSFFRLICTMKQIKMSKFSNDKSTLGEKWTTCISKIISLTNFADLRVIYNYEKITRIFCKRFNQH